MLDVFQAGRVNALSGQLVQQPRLINRAERDRVQRRRQQAVDAGKVAALGLDATRFVAQHRGVQAAQLLFREAERSDKGAGVDTPRLTEIAEVLRDLRALQVLADLVAMLGQAFDRFDVAAVCCGLGGRQVAFLVGAARQQGFGLTHRGEPALLELGDESMTDLTGHGTTFRGTASRRPPTDGGTGSVFDWNRSRAAISPRSLGAVTSHRITVWCS